MSHFASSGTNPTHEELENLPLAISRLWELDFNRLEPSRDYTLNLQHGKCSYESGDYASEPLFSSISPEVFERPTFKTFIALMDNYVSQTGVTEIVTGEERRENAAFLRAIMETPVMQYTHQYLLQHHKTTARDTGAFIRELDEFWFGLYTRKRTNDSSGFEHVFVGEVNEKGEVIGFHNWINLFLEERAGRLNYLGYILPRRRGRHESEPHDNEQLVTIQFTWNGHLKPVSSSLIGTSPEFEFALYTLCFFMGNEKTQMELGPYRVEVTCYRYPSNPRPGQKVRIGTSYPSEIH